MQGCTTVPSDEDRTQAAVQTDVSNMHEDLNMLRGRADHLEAQTEELRMSVRALGSGDVAGKAAVEKRLNAMELHIRATDEAREADKKDIIEKLSQKLADVINRNRGSGERESSRSAQGDIPAGAIKHVVKDKESLSVIAQKYGVTVNAILEANRLKNANVVRVGQVLAIPR
ncbi:MAG: LysM domain-containing protein [bacterium]